MEDQNQNSVQINEALTILINMQSILTQQGNQWSVWNPNRLNSIHDEISCALAMVSSLMRGIERSDFKFLAVRMTTISFVDFIKCIRVPSNATEFETDQAIAQRRQMSKQCSDLISHFKLILS